MNKIHSLDTLVAGQLKTKLDLNTRLGECADPDVVLSRLELVNFIGTTAILSTEDESARFASYHSFVLSWKQVDERTRYRFRYEIKFDW